MHCPENVKGEEYIALVAAVSLLLSRNLGETETFVLAEFLDAVSDQLFLLGSFKAAEAKRTKPP